MLCGDEQYDEVLYGFGEDDVCQDLQQFWQVVYLCCEYGFYQWVGVGDCCEVVVVEYVFVGGYEVQVVVVFLGWCLVFGVEVQYFVGDEEVVVVVGDQVGVKGGSYDLQGVDCFVMVQSYGGEGCGVQDCDIGLCEVVVQVLYGFVFDVVCVLKGWCYCMESFGNGCFWGIG